MTLPTPNTHTGSLPLARYQTLRRADEGVYAAGCLNAAVVKFRANMPLCPRKARKGPPRGRREEGVRVSGEIFAHENFAKVSKEINNSFERKQNSKVVSK